jgi:hypothetical protein
MQVLHGDCRETLNLFPDEHFDAGREALRAIEAGQR